MDCTEIRYDTRAPHTPEELAEMNKNAEMLYRFNQAMPGSAEASAALCELLDAERCEAQKG